MSIAAFTDGRLIASSQYKTTAAFNLAVSRENVRDCNLDTTTKQTVMQLLDDKIDAMENPRVRVPEQPQESRFIRALKNLGL